MLVGISSFVLDLYEQGAESVINTEGENVRGYLSLALRL